MRSASKGLIRSMSRRGVKADKSPPVARKTSGIKEAAVCERCGAVFSRKTWRTDHRPTSAVLERATWMICPACEQVAGGEYFGKVAIGGEGVAPGLDAIRGRIANIARRASTTQPEHRVVSTDWNGTTLEVLTTSQKLAHRIAHELKKAFGGTTSYRWSERDGSLLATWRCPGRRTKR
jgi:NMD protein affecting ribosome stability and mRNA decay